MYRLTFKFASGPKITRHVESPMSIALVVQEYSDEWVSGHNVGGIVKITVKKVKDV